MCQNPILSLLKYYMESCFIILISLLLIIKVQTLIYILVDTLKFTYFLIVFALPLVVPLLVHFGFAFFWPFLNTHLFLPVSLHYFLINLVYYLLLKPSDSRIMILLWREWKNLFRVEENYLPIIHASRYSVNYTLSVINLYMSHFPYAYHYCNLNNGK